MRTIDLTHLILLLFGYTVMAQHTVPGYNFHTIKESSSQRAVSSIAQDRDGLIWMGTNGVGLSRFNGIDFRYYQQKSNDSTSISGSLVYDTYIDGDNRLWVGTQAGLDLYDRAHDRFVHIDLKPGSDVSGAIPVKSIAEDGKGNLIAGTLQNSVFFIDGETLQSAPIPIEGTRNRDVLLINSVAGNGNHLFIGTDSGLFEYLASENQFVPFRTDSSKKEKVSDDIQSLYFDSDDNLWIGTFSNGVKKLSFSNRGAEIDHFPITEKRILSMVQGTNNDILFGTENDGLFVLDKQGKVLTIYRYNKFNKNSIKSNSIWSLFKDRQKRIWIGYYNEGVGINDRSYDKFNDIESLPSVSNSLQSGSVTGIVKDDQGRLWIGMNGGGVDVYDPKDQSFVHLSDPENSMATGLTALDVQTVFMDSKDNLWVGTWNSGIFYLENNGTNFKNFNSTTTNGAIASNRILSFTEDDHGVIWIGTFLKGLYSYDPETESFTFYNSPPFTAYGIDFADIRKVLVDTEGVLWLGTVKGLFKVVKTGNFNFQVVTMEDAMYEPIGKGSGDHTVLSLFEDNDGILWIGTDGDGLCKYDPQTDSFIWYDQDKGMEQESVSVIMESGGHLWIGGNKGLSKLNIKTGMFSKFTKEDGLLSNDFNNNSVLKDDDGTLYFGSYRGINYFVPGTIPLNEHPPSLYFSGLKLFNKSIELGAKGSPIQQVLSETSNLTLDHKQSVFTIDYVGISYTRPDQNEYAYKLEGFEDTYNYVGNSRSATYTNLPKGNYLFKVKAANNDGIWTDEPITLPIEIVPPWWGTNLAIASYFILALLLLFLAYRIFYDRIRERRIIKFERERRVQEEALNDRKIQFFTNISHEFRTPLTLITNPLADIIDDTDSNLPKKIRDKHRIIQKNTARLSRLVDELLDFRKLQLDKMPVRASRVDAVPFVREVADYFEDEALQRNILLSVESDAPELIIWSDPGMLEKIIFNILSNAFKATPENGAVTVSISSCNRDVHFPLIEVEKPLPAMEILITDTGSGIKQKEIDHIFERFYQAEEMNQQYYSGTGIGLEVVRNFVALHRGKIEVDSQQNRGTTFKIILPLGNDHFEFTELFLKKEETGTPRQNEIEDTSEEIATTAPSKKRTLLLVEDNAELRHYLKEVLKQEYTITEASNGKEALAIAGKMIPDIIVTDVVMPEMDGNEFCTLLRDDLKTSHIPVLMLTAKAMSDDWVKGIEAGADVYLSKPFEMKVLKSQLKQLILNRQLLFNKYFGSILKTEIEDSGTSLDKDFITKVLNYVHANIDDPNLNVENLAEELKLSRSQLYRKIKALTGQTANQFLRAVRLEKSKEMILHGNDSIGEISFKVGFSSPSYFTSCFKTHFGILPTEVNEA